MFPLTTWACFYLGMVWICNLTFQNWIMRISQNQNSPNFIRPLICSSHLPCLFLAPWLPLFSVASGYKLLIFLLQCQQFSTKFLHLFPRLHFQRLTWRSCSFLATATDPWFCDGVSFICNKPSILTWFICICVYKICVHKMYTYIYVCSFIDS